MNQRLCYVSPVSIHSTRWMEAFREMDLDVSLITDSQTWAAQRPRGVAIYALPTLALNNFQRRLIPNYVSMMRIIKHLKPDLVHLHEQHHYAPVAALSRVPFVLHSWGFEVLELSRMSIFRRTLAKFAAARAGKIVVDAKCMKKIWVSMGVPERKVEVIPFGVDTRLFSPSVDGRATRRSLGLKESDVVVISIRPFFPHYDTECLIRAASLVEKKHRNVKFVVKGQGPLETRVRKLVAKLDIGRCVRFSRQVPYVEVPGYLSASDIYVSTSFVDSTSVSLLEAMACGLPPVTTDIAGNREWVRHGVNGLLYPPSDYSALAERLIELVEDESLRERFGAKCRQLVVEKASWDKCVSRMRLVYDELL